MDRTRDKIAKKRVQIIGVATTLIVLLAWQCLTFILNIDGKLFPSPLRVLSAFVSMVKEGSIISDTLISSFRAILGFVVGSFLAIIFGLITGRNEKVRESFGFVLNVLRPIPAIAIVPLVIIWFGLGEFSKIFIITWGVFFPVWINTHIGVTSVDIKHVWAAKSLGAKQWNVLWEVILPSATSSIVAGMRIGISIAFICLVAAEMAGAAKGLGFRITFSHLTFRTDQMVASIFTLGLAGAVADRGFTWLCQKLFPWYHHNGRAL